MAVNVIARKSRLHGTACSPPANWWKRKAASQRAYLHTLRIMKKVEELLWDCRLEVATHAQAAASEAWP